MNYSMLKGLTLILYFILIAVLFLLVWVSFRGIDNAAYYRMVPQNERYHQDFTGCGNSLDTMHARGMQLVLDSLRTWVQDMHVDGFRFDLAPVLGRGPYGEHVETFWNALQQDPLLSKVKLCVWMRLLKAPVVDPL